MHSYVRNDRLSTYLMCPDNQVEIMFAIKLLDDVRPKLQKQLSHKVR